MSTHPWPPPPAYPPTAHLPISNAKLWIKTHRAISLAGACVVLVLLIVALNQIIIAAVAPDNPAAYREGYRRGAMLLGAPVGDVDAVRAGCDEWIRQSSLIEPLPDGAAFHHDDLVSGCVDRVMGRPSRA